VTQLRDGPLDANSHPPGKNSRRSAARASDLRTQAKSRKRRESVERALNEREGAERHKLRQREIMRGGSPGEGRAHPLEFDASGFSIPQPVSSFVRRVGRLINDG